jgi:hypothetical protein
MKNLFLSLLLLTGCATHQMSGHIDTTPRVEIQRANAPQLCRTGEKTKITYFIHLLFMPAQDVFFTANEGPELNLFGTNLTVSVNAECKPGYGCLHSLKARVGQKIYTIDTLVIDCGEFLKGNS